MTIPIDKIYLEGLVFLIDEEDLQISTDIFINNLHRIKNPFFQIKETNGPLINRIIAITVQIIDRKVYTKDVFKHLDMDAIPLIKYIKEKIVYCSRDCFYSNY